MEAEKKKATQKAIDEEAARQKAEQERQQAIARAALESKNKLALESGAAQGKALYDSTVGPGGLGKVNEARSQQLSDVIRQAQETASSGATEYQKMASDKLAGLTSLTQNEIQLEKDAQARLANAKRSEETQKMLDMLMGTAQAAGTRSSEIQALIDARQSGLGGLTAEENNALQSQYLNSIGRGEQTALRQLRGIQGQSGLSGGLASAQQAGLLNQFNQQRAQADQELFLKNIMAKQEARNALEGLVTSQTAAENQNRLQGQQLYGNTLLAANEQDEAQRQAAMSSLASILSANRSGLTQAASGLGSNEANIQTQRLAAQSALQKAIADAEAADLQKQQFNIAQDAKAKELALTTMLGSQNAALQAQSGIEAQVLAQTQADQALRNQVSSDMKEKA